MTLQYKIQYGRRLLSLWDLLEIMDTFTANKLIGYAHALGKMETSLLAHLSPGSASVPDPGIDSEEVRSLLKSLGMTTSMAALDALDQSINIGAERQNAPPFYLQALLEDTRLKASHLSFTIIHELREVQFLHLNTPQLYSNPLDGWADVLAQWPEAEYDIKHASQCLALGEWTACVFHLVRIAEHGLRRACAKYLSSHLPKAGSMGIYLTAIDGFYAKNPTAPGRAELTEAVAYFRSIKNVWRDNVAHAGMKFDNDEAERIYRAVRDMLNHCAKIV